MLELGRSIELSSLTRSSWNFLVEVVNYYHKALHLGCCRSPRSTSGDSSRCSFAYLNFILQGGLNGMSYKHSEAVVRRCSDKIEVLKNVAIFTVKHF